MPVDESFWFHNHQGVFPVEKSRPDDRGEAGGVVLAWVRALPAIARMLSIARTSSGPLAREISVEPMLAKSLRASKYSTFIQSGREGSVLCRGLTRSLRRSHTCSSRCGSDGHRFRGVPQHLSCRRTRPRSADLGLECCPHRSQKIEDGLRLFITPPSYMHLDGGIGFV
jgi:hypothetical protein